MKVTVVEGGMNGIMTAWKLLKLRDNVSLFEKYEIKKQTSLWASFVGSDKILICVFGGKCVTSRQLAKNVWGQ